MKKPIIISGIAASGKTHIAKALAAQYDKNDVLWLNPALFEVNLQHSMGAHKLVIIDECTSVNQISRFQRDIGKMIEENNGIQVVYATCATDISLQYEAKFYIIYTNYRS